MAANQESRVGEGLIVGAISGWAWDWAIGALFDAGIKALGGEGTHSPLFLVILGAVLPGAILGMILGALGSKPHGVIAGVGIFSVLGIWNGIVGFVVGVILGTGIGGVGDKKPT